MDAQPDFLEKDVPSQAGGAEVFRPAGANRRGEALAWICALGFALVAFVGSWRGGQPVRFSAELALFFVIAGAWISFGNWIDRDSEVRLTAGGIRYHSPLRTVQLGYADVQELWAIPSAASWRVIVRGLGGQFAFRTATEFRWGQRSLSAGYPEGERLAALIRSRAGLSQPSPSDGEWVSRRSAQSAI